MNSCGGLFAKFHFYHNQNYKKFLGNVKKAIQTTNPDYDIVIRRLHLYYDMKLVTFWIDEDGNLIV